ncbi:MAG: NAD-dependent epimerase/dehydratase family protein [Candidatus Lernaella stagnicola]|nr:NAD-dependent epimerase/dehydratase family protein [Candidatus Lernaella stagnicola]
MIAAVTGASGHIGGALVRELLAQGHRVRALVRRDTAALEGLNVERVAASLEDIDSLVAAFQGADWVFHLASRISIAGDPDGSVYRANVIGTRNVIEAVRRAGATRLIHFSTIQTLSHEPREQPVDETRPAANADFVGAYDRTKAESEADVLAAATQELDAVIVQPTGVIGPHDFKPSRMGRFFIALANRRLPSLVAGGFDWVDVRDVAAGAVAAAERGRRGERYIFGGHHATLHRLAELASDATGIAPPRFVTPLWLARAAAPVAEVWARTTRAEPLFTRESVRTIGLQVRVNSDKARSELSYRVRPLEDTVRDLYGWFTTENRLHLR